MKNLLLLTLCLIVAIRAFSQCQEKGITTNPSQPVNTENSDFENDFFDWRTNTFTTNSQYNPTTLASPFQNLLNASVSHFYFSKDMRPEDGWELVKHDMGYKVDGTPLLTGHVYIVLYNKFSGMLRVMLAGKDQAYNGASIKIKFNGSTNVPSSVISNSSRLFPLDTFEPSPTITGTSRYINDFHNWFYADFYMSYDPCTCLFQSKLEIEVKLIESSEIDLSGTFNGKITSIQSKTNGPGVKQNGFSVSNLSDLENAAQGAQKSYKSISSFTDDLLKSSIASTDEWDDIDAIVQSELYDAPLAELEEALEDLGEPSELLQYSDRKQNINQLQSLLQSSNFLQAGLKAVPYVGAALEFVKFFTAGGKQAAGPQLVELTPMAINADIKVYGSIQTSYTYKDITFFTPGSLNSANPLFPDAYPYYNEVLGVFNLLRTPKIYLKEEEFNIKEGTPGNQDWLERQRHMVAYHLPQVYNGARNIQYVVNPASGLDVNKIEIFGQLVFSKPDGGGITRIISQTEMLPIESLHGFSYVMGYDKGVDYYGTWDDNLGCSYETPTIAELKLFVNLPRKNPSANTQNVLFVGAYVLQPIATTNITAGVSYCSMDTNLSFSNTTITQNFQARETMNIGNNVTFQPNITLKAKKVTIGPSTTIPPNVTISGSYVAPGSSYISPMTTTEVATFCNSSVYTSPSRAVRASAPNNGEGPSRDEKELTFSSYPNPTQGSIVVEYFLKMPANVDIEFTDLSGKIVYAPIKNADRVAGGHKEEFDLSSFRSGFYFCTIKAGERTRTIKVIIK